MTWRNFWQWVDRDFNNIRPLSLVPFCGVAALPLLFAFLLEASTDVVEAARLVTLGGVMVILGYYLYRSAFNIARAFKSAFGPANATKGGDRLDG